MDTTLTYDGAGYSSADRPRRRRRTYEAYEGGDGRYDKDAIHAAALAVLADRAAGASDRAALATLVDECAPFVAAIAVRYRGRLRLLDLDDLRQAGMTGVLRAVDKFTPDTRHGVLFTTYAYNWVRQRIRRALIAANERTILIAPATLAALFQTRLPDAVVATLDDAELAKSLGTAGVPARVRQAARVRMARSVPQSYWQYSLASSGRGDDPVEEASVRELRGRLVAALRCLPRRRAAIVSIRLGLDGGAPSSLEETAERVRPYNDGKKMTRERVRQLLGAALPRWLRAVGVPDASIPATVARVNEAIGRPDCIRAVAVAAALPQSA